MDDQRSAINLILSDIRSISGFSMSLPLFLRIEIVIGWLICVLDKSHVIGWQRSG